MAEKRRTLSIHKNKAARAQPMAAPAKRSDSKPQIPVWPLYLLLILLAALYIFVRFTGPILLILFIVIIALEIINMLRSGTGRRALAELGAVVLIIGIAWLGLILAFGNTSPIDVVPSCSMLPTLHVGDVIFVKSVPITGITAPLLNVNAAQTTRFIANLTSNSYECVAFNPSNPGVVSQYVLPGYAVGLYTYNKKTGRSYLNPEQAGLIRFNCGTSQIRYTNGTTAEEAALASITVANQTIYPNLNNSIIVYRTVKNDSFYAAGDTYVVHRAYAILDANGTYYVLTKGDNNPGLDIQYINVPPNTSQIDGKVIFSIPYLGYVKLALSGVNQNAGCSHQFVN